MRVEKDIRRAEAMQLFQAVDGQQNEKLERCLHVLLTYAENWDIEHYKRHSVFNVKRGSNKTRFSAIYYPTAYSFEKDPNELDTKMCTSPLRQKKFPLEKLIEEPIKTIRTFNS